ncbi:MAG: hypothetical protein HY803_13420 [candidate division NC10 bacterium]|nr:hypothetical protein [candidate division NC10 bacterium]
MISLRQINALPAVERDRCYLSIIPSSFYERFGLDPLTFTDPQGRQLASLEAPLDKASVRLSIKHRADALDPAFFLKLDESRYGSLLITWIILNDPEGPRFGIDLDDEGRITELGARSRNLREEESAMRAGLTPGQIRPGLRMLRSTLDRIEAFAARLEKPALVLEAFFYHNALIYERHGFAYLAGQERLEVLHRGFLPGGELEARLDGRTPFRTPAAGASIRGRSWALHDGILPRPWWPPMMYRPIGVRFQICTAPGVPF